MNTLFREPDIAFTALWGAWVVSWFAAALWSDRAEKRIGIDREILYRAAFVAGFLLFSIPDGDGLLGRRLWPVSYAQMWVCVGVAALGFALCWWARIHLGRLWSGRITKKGNHRIVDTGPYALVRHPIYTGLLLAILATMAAKATLAALIGTGVIVLGIWMKARLEEQFLREELWPEAYDAYRRRVPMLVPFGPKSA